MEKPHTGWTYLDASGLVTGDLCLVWGFIVYPSASGGYASVYDGLDTASGRLFGVLRCGVQGSTSFLFLKPVHFDRGLYIDFTSNITGVTVLWEPSD